MAQEENWETFDDDDEEETVSLCDFPIVIDDGTDCPREDHIESKSPHAEDFEFQGGLLSKTAEIEDMCAADDVFFEGQILPLRPSVSSECGLLPRSWSRSDSMDHSSSTTITSSGFDSGRSLSSSRCSSRCISRSHSSNSFSSSYEAPRISISSNFYAHPSPTPQFYQSSERKRNVVGRRSTSTPVTGWGFFRLGLVKTPEIELLRDLRARRTSSGGRSNGSGGGSSRKSNSETIPEKKAPGFKEGKDSRTKCNSKLQEVEQRFFRRGFGCKCSTEAVDAISSRILITKKKKEEGLGLKSEESMCRNRTFEWLEELSMAKATVLA